MTRYSALTHLPLDKMAAISLTIYPNVFLKWKYLNFKLDFIEIRSLGSNWQYVCIDSDNGLAPNGRQAIIWITADPIHGRIYAALGGDEWIAISMIIHDAWITNIKVIDSWMNIHLKNNASKFHIQILCEKIHQQCSLFTWTAIDRYVKYNCIK